MNTIESALGIDSSEYMLLTEPKFEGQTKADKDGWYKMYWSNKGKFYFTRQNINN